MKRAALLAAAALSFAGAQATLPSDTAREQMRALPVARPATDAVRKAIRSGGLRHFTGGYRRGPGWSYAQVKRQALKARNVARHKAHCKGGGSRASRKSARGCRA